jgi:integrase
MWDVTVGGRRMTGTCSTLTEAVLAREQAQNEKAKKGMTLGEALKIAHRDFWAGTKAEDTTLLNAGVVERFFGPDIEVADLTRDRVEDFIRHLEAKGNSNSTINRKLAVLGRVWTVAEDRGIIEGRPKIRRRPEPKGRIRYLQPHEEEQIFQTLDLWGDKDLKDVITCLIDTGMRTGELLKLTAQDVSFPKGCPHGVLHLTDTKNGESRAVPMTARVADIVKSRMLGKSRLFPYKKSWLRSGWDRLRIHLGKEDDTEFVPHMLRHTCASRLVQRGVSLPKVGMWLGHTNPTTTKRYAHLSPTDLYEVVGVLQS